MSSLTNTNLTFTGESGAHYSRRQWKSDALVMEWEIPASGAGAAKNYAYGAAHITNRTFKIDWGDGNIDSYSGATTVFLTHTYAAAGTYIVQLYDQANDGIEVMRFGSGSGHSYTGTNNQVKNILQWPSGYSIDSWQKMFFDCDNIGAVTATNIPNLSATRFMTSLFENTNNNPKLNKSLENWDTSYVQDMRYMFKYTKMFNSEYLIDQNDLTRSGWYVNYITTTAWTTTLPSGATGTATRLEFSSGLGGSAQQYGGPVTPSNDRLTNNVGGERVFGIWVKRYGSMGTTTFFTTVGFSNENASVSKTHTVSHTEGWKYVTVSTSGSASGKDYVSIGTYGAGGGLQVWGANLSINGETDEGAFNIGLWDVTGLTSAKGATNMFFSNNAVLEEWSMSTKRYDQLLIGWGAQADNVNSGVNLSVGSTKYTAGGDAAAGRAALVAAGWTITDGGTT